MRRDSLGRLTVSEVIEALAGAYGYPSPRKPPLDPVSELIRTVLSQNTSDVNSWRAYYSLREAFPTWEEVTQAPVGAIASAIWMGGLGRVKAPRIKAILQEVLARRGSLGLGFLREWPREEARRWLQGIPGVGPKTASCVLLFSLDIPALPVDTHVHRVARRLGLLDSRVSAKEAQKLLEYLVPPEEYYPFHLLLIEHGRRVCKARRPAYERCPLGERCPDRPGQGEKGDGYG